MSRPRVRQSFSARSASLRAFSHQPMSMSSVALTLGVSGRSASGDTGATPGGRSSPAPYVVEGIDQFPPGSELELRDISLSAKFVEPEGVAHQQRVPILVFLDPGPERAGHAGIADVIDGVVLALGVEVLHAVLVMLHHRQGADRILAMIDEEHHRIAVLVA